MTIFNFSLNYMNIHILYQEEDDLNEENVLKTET